MTARETYQAETEELGTEIQLLQKLIEDNDKGEKLNWGHVGNIEHVRTLVGEAIQFLSSGTYRFVRPDGKTVRVTIPTD